MQPRRKGYAFRIKVPLALQSKFGRTYIVEGLRTDSPHVAETAALKRLTHWHNVFDRAVANVPMTLGEIQAEAMEMYRVTLARMANEAATWREIIGNEFDWLHINLERCEKALTASDFASVTPEIEAIERRKGIALPPDSVAFSNLAQALLRAEIAAITGRMKALEGQASEPPANFLGPAGVDEVTLKPIQLSYPITRGRNARDPWALFEQWINLVKPAASSVNRWRAVFLNLQSKYGTNEISEHEARKWARELITTERSPRTVAEVWVNAARTIYGWAVEERLLDSNPFKEVRVTVPTKTHTRETKAFTTEEAQTILRAASKIKPSTTFEGAQRWVPWLQAYSGARAGELTQLRTDDIVQANGVWCMKLTPEAGTIKTKRPRTVPLHSHIIAQGFLKFVEEREGPLFYNPINGNDEHDVTNPRRPRAVKTRERLAGWVRELGITHPEISPTHAWRHLFKQLADAAGISEKMSDYITGHSSANVARTYGVPTLKDMTAALQKFPKYSG
jgi:integrase